MFLMDTDPTSSIANPALFVSWSRIVALVGVRNLVANHKHNRSTVTNIGGTRGARRLPIRQRDDAPSTYVRMYDEEGKGGGRSSSPQPGHTVDLYIRSCI